MKHLIAFLSLFWALGSGYLAVRDYEHVLRLIVSAGILLSVVVVLELLLLVINDLHWANQRLKSFFSHSYTKWSVSTIFQMQVQYVAMFFTPFLYWIKSWQFLFLNVFFVIAAVWDPFWNKLFHFWIFRSLTRYWILNLVLVFLVVLFFPKYIVYLNLIVMCFLLAYFLTSFSLFFFLSKNFNIFIDLDTKKHPNLGSFFVVWVAVFCFFLTSYFREGSFFPPVGLWLKEPRLHGVARARAPGDSPSSAEICCETPLVLKARVPLPVTHFWYLDGKLIDVIELSEVVGLGMERGYRTRSCKKVFPVFEVGQVLKCVVKIYDNVTVGKIETTVVPSDSKL